MHPRQRSRGGCTGTQRARAANMSAEAVIRTPRRSTRNRGPPLTWVFAKVPAWQSADAIWGHSACGCRAGGRETVLAIAGSQATSVSPLSDRALHRQPTLFPGEITSATRRERTDCQARESGRGLCGARECGVMPRESPFALLRIQGHGDWVAVEFTSASACASQLE